MKKEEQCYKCSAPATSKEHVPPLCLFPEKKDVGGDIFRKNLITVPSCDLHNTKKSSDDEFLMACIASVVGNNALGYVHTNTKVRRAMARKSKHFIKSLMENPEEFTVNIQERKYPMYIGSPNFKRLNKCFEHITYGLYYAEYNNVFRGECRVLLGFVTFHEENREKLKQFCKRRFEADKTKLELKGANPQIFTYQFISPDEFGIIALKMTFYEGAEVFVSLIPESTTEPYLLALDLIKSGVKTIINLGDNEKFEFNFDK